MGIVLLLGKTDGLRFLAAQLHLERRAFGRDRKPAVAQLADQVEGLSRDLLQREPQRILLDASLHRRAHLRRRPEEAIGRDEPIQRLVRPMEVVAVHEERHSPLAIGEIGEDRAREEFIPQGLPEALDLAQGLRVLRPAGDMRNSVLPQPLFEFGHAAPGPVLPALVGEDLARLAVRCDATLQGLDHQRGALMVRQQVRGHEARVVVLEADQVQPLVTSEQEGEDVRLPHLVGLGALEAPRRTRTPVTDCRLRCQQSRLVENSPHGGRRHSDGLEAAQQIADLAHPLSRIFLLGRHDPVANRVSRLSRTRRPPWPLRDERVWAIETDAADPVGQRYPRQAERLRHQVRRLALLQDFSDRQLLQLLGVGAPAASLAFSTRALQRGACAVATAHAPLRPLARLFARPSVRPTVLTTHVVLPFRDPCPESRAFVAMGIRVRSDAH